jgi:prefoldin subunit 5
MTQPLKITELKRLILQWIKIDDDIVFLKQQMDELDDTQDDITTNLLDHVEEHGMVGKQVNIPGGSIEFKNKSRTASLTQKVVIAALHAHGIESGAVMDTIRELKSREKREQIYVVRHYDEVEDVVADE